ncbi:MAG: SAM-dependent methyltransferase [Desulfoprunum sp.]|jgi:hypothetical protein
MKVGVKIDANFIGTFPLSVNTSLLYSKNRTLIPHENVLQDFGSRETGLFMQADFLDAHLHHWEDAGYLFDNCRWANADHLYGISAECGLKRLMMAFGMPLDSTSSAPMQREDRIHARQAWSRYEAYRSGHRQGAAYQLSTNNPFADWDISDRYAHRSSFDQARAEAHRQGAHVVLSLIKKAIFEGLIP